MQIDEAQKHTNNLQQNSKKEVCHIENVNSHVEFKQKSWKFEPWQKVMLESTSLTHQHDSDALIHEEK